MKLLVIFIILNVINVILQTIKSLCTIKCGKTMAAIVNAVAYGLYTVVLVYTNADFPLWEKVLVVGSCNLIGVYVVKAIEQKMRKDKLWLVKVTVKNGRAYGLRTELAENGISFSNIRIDGYQVLDCYCNTQKETEIVTRLAKKFECKMFATENKLW